MLTNWWVQNQILIQVYKRYLFFLPFPVHLDSKFSNGARREELKENHMGNKQGELYAEFKSDF